MEYQIGPYQVWIDIIKKKNKNIYIRVKENQVITVTTPLFTTKKQILDLLKQNEKYLLNCLEKQSLKQERQDKFYLWGQAYEIVVIPTTKEVVVEDVIITPNMIDLDKWLKKEITDTFQKRLDFWYNCYKETIPYPKLRIRKMKTRWGVCNRKNNTVTLNSELVRYSKPCLDYVIVHELSHFVHFNHSKEFWNQVSKYCPNYPEIKKELKN